MHQTVIGQEAIKQLEMAGDFPDIIIAPFGGGSNFAEIAFPFFSGLNLRKEKIFGVLPLNLLVVLNLQRENSDMISVTLLV